MRGIWALFHPGETLRCTQCERGFGEVYPGTDVMVRVTPAESDGVRAHMSRRCDRCRAMLQLIVIETDDGGAGEDGATEAPPC